MGLSLDLGWGSRYSDADGDGESLEEVSDPHVTENETATSLTGRILQYRWWALTAGLLAAAIILWLGFLTTNVIPSLLTNIWTYRVGAGVAIFGVAYRMGYSRRRAAAEETDELVLVESNRVRRFRGEYRPDAGSAPWFVPFAGTSGWWLFKSQDRYQVGDIAEDMTQLRSRPDLDPDDEVTIRIDQGGRADSRLLWEIETDTGTVVVALTGELKAAHGAHSTILRTTIPDVAHEDQLTDIEAALREAEAQRRQAEKERDVMRTRMNQALELAEEAQEQTLQNFVENYRKIEEASGHHGRPNDEQSNGDGDLSEIQSILAGDDQ